MSLAENLLNSLETTNVANSYSVVNEEPHIVVGADRNIIVPQSLRKIAVTGDTGVETVTFDCVRYWDGNDLSTFAIYLNYVLPDRSIGTYIPKSITANYGEDVYHFDWEIDRYMTKTNGTIAFAITAIKTKLNENGETVVDKQWGSFPNTECSIVEGVDIANVPDNEETADILSQITSILEQIQNDNSNIPDYWKPALENGVFGINQALCNAGWNKSAFLFYSDAHFDYGSQMSPLLLKYLYEHTGMTKTIFGGDIVNSEGSDYDTMAYLWQWRNMLKGLPNHHSVVGNHDDGNSTNNLFSAKYVYGYLLAAEETSDMVVGEGLYYYIDSTAEKTRYLYLDTAYKVDSNSFSTQINFIKESLKSTPSGWHIVVVSHIWYVPDYDNYNVRPIPILGLSPEAEEICNILDNYNMRQGEFSIGSARVEFCIGGHVHRDYIGETNGGIPIVLVETDSKHIRSEHNYTEGTTTEASVNGVVADYDSSKLSVIRIGRGENFYVDLSGKGLPYFGITQKLTNVKSSNEQTSVVEGDPFETTLTATVGELTSVVVTEGGVDITNEVYSDGVVYIGFVRGNVVITAVAEEPEPEPEPEEPDTPTTYTNLIPTAVDTDGVTIYNGKGWKENTRMSGSSGGFMDSDTSCCTGYIPLPKGTLTIRFKNITHGTANYGGNFYFFNGTGVKVADSVDYPNIQGSLKQYYNPVLDGDNIVQITVNNPNGEYTHMVHSAVKIDDTSVITINEPIE